jgi:hypothetical protein
MATSLTDALSASLIASMNPDTVALRKYLDVTIREKSQDLVLLKVESIELVQSKLKKAVDDKASASVIAAYEKLLAQAIAA